MKWISVACGIALLIGAIFFAGMWTTHKRWPAWQVIADLLPYSRSYRDTGLFLPDKSYRALTEDVLPQRYFKEPDYDPKGYLFLARLNPSNGFAIAEVLDGEGQAVHQWDIIAPDIFPETTDKSQPHAVRPLADGSILVNFDTGPGMARLDVCGDPIWTKSDWVYHHSFHSEGDNTFWTWTSFDDSLGHDQNLHKFAIEDGRPLETINLIDDIIVATKGGLTEFGLPLGYEFHRGPGKPPSRLDIFHPNDVEPLTPEMAWAFPQFSAGDLLISLRNINMIAVIDRETHEVLWAQHGPWVEQHDPDFQPDGTISVFANNKNRSLSRIVSVNPTTNETVEIFGEAAEKFRTSAMGKHERLPNGNWLVVSSMEGRVLELDAQGKMLRQYVNLVAPGYAAVISTAYILEPDYFDGVLSCDG